MLCTAAVADAVLPEFQLMLLLFCFGHAAIGIH
jgi:hypothetical protein